MDCLQSLLYFLVLKENFQGSKEEKRLTGNKGGGKGGEPLCFGIKALALQQRKCHHQSFEGDAHIKGSTHLLLVTS